MILLDFFWKIIVFIRILLKKEDKLRFKEKFGISTEKNNSNLPLIWIHCVSVGEMNSMIKIIKEITEMKKYFILLTTTTVASAKVASSFKYDNFIHQFNPCDSPNFLRRFLKNWQPIKMILCESEFWPFTIIETAKIAEIYLVNARLSDKSFKNWKFFGKFFKNILSKFKKVFPSSEDSRRNFLYFDSRNISDFVCNTKFLNFEDIMQKTKKDENIIEKIKTNLKRSKVLTFGSLHFQDLEEILDQIKKIINSEKGKNIKLFILPRYIDLSQNFYNLLKENNISSTVIQNENDYEAIKNYQVVIVKKMSVIHIFYSVANFCLTGGSFSFKTNGSHNPLESLFLGKTTIIGENNKNIRKTMPDLFRNEILKIMPVKDISVYILDHIFKDSLNKSLSRKINDIVEKNILNEKDIIYQVFS